MSASETFKNIFGRDPTTNELNEIRGRYGDSIEPGEFQQFVLDKRDSNVGYGVPTTKSVTPVYGYRSAGVGEYGEPIQEAYITGYKDAQGNAVDPSLVTVEQVYYGGDGGDFQTVYSTAVEAPTYSGAGGVINKLTQQILSQGTTGRWGGEGYGSAQKSAADMALLLAAAGLTNIKDFGVRDRLMPGQVEHTEQGSLQSPDYTIKEYYNKATDKPIDAHYNKSGGNIWSGTFAGKGSTAYGVQFTPDGTPVFYSQYGGSSNDFANFMEDLGPIAQIGLAIATGGLSIPQQIAAQMAVQVLSGKDVGDAIKSAAISMAVANIPGSDLIKEGASYLNGIDPSGVLAGAFQNAAVSGVRAALTGDSIGDAVLAGAASGGINGAIGAMLKTPEFANLTDAQKKIATNAITGVISGKPLDQVLINSAIAAAKAELASSKAEASGGIQNRINDEAIPRGGVEQQLTDAGLTTGGGSDLGLPEDTVEVGSSGADPYKFVADNLAPDEKIIGSTTRADGSIAVLVERTNPNDPSEKITYEAVKDADTGDVFYEWGGFDTDEEGVPQFGSTVSSGSKPSWTWGAEGAPGTPTEQPEPTPEEPPLDIEDILRELDAGSGATTPPVTPAPVQPAPVEPAPVEPAPTKPVPETPTEGQPGFQGPMGPADEATDKRFKDELEKYLAYLEAGEPPPPDYSIQDMGITPENWDAYSKQMLEMDAKGELPSQWKPGADGAFTYTDEDGSILTIDAGGNIVGVTDAPPGMLPGAIQQAAAEQARQANIRTTAIQAQTSAQGIMQQLEAMQKAGMAPQQAQLVEAGPGFDLSDPLNTGFFSGFQAKKAQQNQQPTTKIAAGGYIDDLLAGDMTADDLLNLLR